MTDRSFKSKKALTCELILISHQIEPYSLQSLHPGFKPTVCSGIFNTTPQLHYLVLLC